MRDTLHSLTSEDAQHAPLYYLLARAWATRFGSSIEAGRAFAALWSLLALAAMYWLCLELFVKTGAFRSHLVCWLGVLAMVLSPYQVAFAKEHREYSMWTLLVALTCAAFLRAVRKNTTGTWLLYSVIISVGFYTHLFSALALAACGVFLLLLERFRFTRRVWSFIAASALAFLVWIPWIMVVLTKREIARSSLSWVEYFSHGRYQFWFSLQPALRMADLSFWDLGTLMKDLPAYRFTHRMAELIPLLALGALWMFTRGPRRICAGFATAMICSVSVPLFLMDFFKGGTSGFGYRYAVPTNLRWLLVLAMALTILTNDLGRWNVLGRALAVGFVLIAAISATLTHDAHHTFNKMADENGEIVALLNTDSRARLVSDDFVAGVLVLAPQVRSDLSVSWRARCFSCDRVAEPVLDIPFPSKGSGETYFFRSWSNTAVNLLVPLLDRLGTDQLGDPRFHTAIMEFTTPSASLFLLTPR